MMKDLLQINSLIEDLDHQVDLLLRKQAKFPTAKGDKRIACLLDQISFLDQKLKGSSEYARKPLMSPVPIGLLLYSSIVDGSKLKQRR